MAQAILAQVAQASVVGCRGVAYQLERWGVTIHVPVPVRLRAVAEIRADGRRHDAGTRAVGRHLAEIDAPGPEAEEVEVVAAAVAVMSTRRHGETRAPLWS